MAPRPVPEHQHGTPEARKPPPARSRRRRSPRSSALRAEQIGPLLCREVRLVGARREGGLDRVQHTRRGEPQYLK